MSGVLWFSPAPVIMPSHMTNKNFLVSEYEVTEMESSVVRSDSSPSEWHVMRQMANNSAPIWAIVIFAGGGRDALVSILCLWRPLGPAQGTVPFLLSIATLAPSGRMAGLMTVWLRFLGGAMRRTDMNQLNMQATVPLGKAALDARHTQRERRHMEHHVRLEAELEDTARCTLEEMVQGLPLNMEQKDMDCHVAGLGDTGMRLPKCEHVDMHVESLQWRRPSSALPFCHMGCQMSIPACACRHC